MCGIIGIVRDQSKQRTQNGAIGKQIFDALSRLEYRGYDSVGVAVVDKNRIQVKKDKGSIRKVGPQLRMSELKGMLAIGHSRWATHGPPSKINAHPHTSMNEEVVVVHNGIIENFISLRNELKEMGYKFKSQTDTELIPHFLSNQLDKGKNMVEAIVELLKRIKGTYSIVIAHVGEPDKIYALKKDNPLVVGVGKNAMYCASDIPAFLPWTKTLVTIRDNELVILEPHGYKIINLLNKKEISRKPHEVTWSPEAAQLGGFPHFMLKEIHEQPKIIQTQLATQKDIFNLLGDRIYEAKKVILIAAGTAHYASLNAYHTFSQYGGPLVIPCVAAEWNSVRHLVDDETIILAVSQSGETLDTIRAIKDAKERNATIASLVNVTGSTLTNYSDHVAYIHAGPEIGVAATKTFIAQSLGVWRISNRIGHLSGTLDRNELKEFDQSFQKLSSAVKKIIQSSELKARNLAKWFSSKKSSFYLGRGISFVTALEGALKMKEISYIHAEAYPAGESKHGPIALIEEDYPVVFTMPQDDTRDKMMGSVQEMAARGATTIGIIEEGDKEMLDTLSHNFEIPKDFSKYLSPIAYVVPQQMLAYYTSSSLGLLVDTPRNLSKSVTVE